MDQSQELAQARPQDNSSKVEGETEKFFAQIPKKTAAAEVLRHLKTFRVIAIGGAIGVFALLIADLFNQFLAYGVALLLILPLAYYLAQTVKEIRRLEYEYGFVQQPKQQGAHQEKKGI
jgi:hypothetical protein